jgi:cell division septal protein FtsQ
MAKRNKKAARKVSKHVKEAKPKTILETLKHWLKKRAQGLPMTTIVIIIIVLIVLAVVVIFFFGQFATGQTTVSSQQAIGGSSTTKATCDAYCKVCIGAKPTGCVCATGSACV